MIALLTTQSSWPDTIFALGCLGVAAIALYRIP